MSRSTSYVVRVTPIGHSVTHGFGDSTTAGWRENFYNAAKSAGNAIYFMGTQSFAGTSNGMAVDPYHMGIDGALFAAITGNCTQASIQLADIVLIEGGTNDAAAGQTGAQMLTSCSTMLDNTNLFLGSSRSWSKIVLQNCFLRGDGFDTAVNIYNAGLAALIAGKSYASKVTLVDGNAILTHAGGDFQDTTHPTDAGYNKYGTALYALVAPLIAGVKNSTALG